MIFEVYFRVKYNVIFEIVGEDFVKFYRVVEELFGEFGVLMFFYNLLMEFYFKLDKRDKEIVIVFLKKFVGVEDGE